MSAMDVPAGRAASEAAARAKAPATQWISWIALAMMTTSSVASLRAAPTMAVYGLACVFLYLLPALVFLLPTSLVSAELASGWKGGVYNWVATGISKPMGFLAVWCQFAMTIFYYPSLLGFVASTLAYVFNPELASSGVWTAAVIIVVYWSGVWVSSRGTKGVAGLASGGLIIGTLIPGVVLGIGYLRTFRDFNVPFTDMPVVSFWLIIALAYAVRRLPYALRSCMAALQQIHVAMEEAAQNLGANGRRTISRVVVPLMAGGILAGFVTSFLTAAVELSATLMLVSATSDAPVSYGIYLYMQSIAGRGPGAALGVVAVVLVAIGTYASHRFVHSRTARLEVQHALKDM